MRAMALLLASGFLGAATAFFGPHTSSPLPLATSHRRVAHSVLFAGQDDKWAVARDSAPRTFQESAEGTLTRSQRSEGTKIGSAEQHKSGASSQSKTLRELVKPYPFAADVIKPLGERTPTQPDYKGDLVSQASQVLKEDVSFDPSQLRAMTMTSQAAAEGPPSTLVANVLYSARGGPQTLATVTVMFMTASVLPYVSRVVRNATKGAVQGFAKQADQPSRKGDRDSMKARVESTTAAQEGKDDKNMHGDGGN